MPGSIQWLLQIRSGARMVPLPNTGAPERFIRGSIVILETHGVVTGLDHVRVVTIFIV